MTIITRPSRQHHLHLREHHHLHHHHHHEMKIGRGVWHVQSTDGVRVWHCRGGGSVFLHLSVLFHCTIASASSLLLYYCICEFSSIVLLHRPVLFHCTIAPLCSLVFSVCACTMHNCAIAHIPTAHCFPLHCSTIWMCWSPLCLSAQITIISEYTQYIWVRKSRIIMIIKFSVGKALKGGLPRPRHCEQSLLIGGMEHTSPIDFLTFL